MEKPLIIDSNVPAFKEWLTNFKLLFQALSMGMNIVFEYQVVLCLNIDNMLLGLHVTAGWDFLHSSHLVYSEDSDSLLYTPWPS